MGLPEDLFADGRQDVVVIVVANIKRQIPIDAFERARAVQAARPAGPNAMFDGRFGQVFDDVPGTTAGNLRFIASARFPHLCDMP